MSVSEGMSTARLKGFVGDSLELLVILSICGLTVAMFLQTEEQRRLISSVWARFCSGELL